MIFKRWISAGRKLHPAVVGPRVKPPFSSGQPLHETRPHSINPGELTPGISAMEYFDRRVKLMSEMPSQSVLVIPGNDLKYLSGAVFYKFHQNTDFYYLSGWNEPNSLIVLEKPTLDLNDVLFHIFVPPRNANAEQWDGDRTGIDGAMEIFNADRLYSSEDPRQFQSEIKKILSRNKTIYYDLMGKKNFFSSFTSSNSTSPAQNTLESLISDLKKRTKPLSPLITELRAIKSDSEIALMRKIGQKSGRAYNRAIAEKFQNERTLDLFLEYNYISSGCSGHAYIPVIAGGSNALHIHYTRNDDIFHSGELVLVDSAAEHGGYKIDISRLWSPLGEKFTPLQRDLYELILDVQKKCIKLSTESSQFSLQKLHNFSLSEMTKNLRNIGFHGLSEYECSQLYPHYIGHNLGLDVHDTPNYSRHKPFTSGQVITVEPGVYVPDSSKYPKWFRNIGIRIEDDIAIGKTSNVILTVELLKEIVDIENIMTNGTKYYEEEDDCVDF